MTTIVVLDTAPPASLFDEAALVGRQVTPAQMAALYNALAGTVAGDPQDTIGWEEIYGADQPLSTGDVPVLTNGLCRVRYVPSASAFAVDFFQAGLGWVEEGRFTCWHDDNGTLAQHGTLIDSDVVEWTPERAVLRVVTSAVAGGTTYRMETYITLQRGWTGPRVECYPSPNAAGAKLGAHVRWSPYSTLDPFQLVIGKAAPVVYQSDVGAVWTTGTYDDFSVALSEPWAAQAGGDRTTVLTVVRAAARIRRYDDIAAYGNTRKAFAVCADYGTSLAGYVSARINFSPEARIVDAETYVFGGTATSVADALASDGFAINETQTAETNNTLIQSVAQTQALGLALGKFGMWVGLRSTVATDTFQVRAGFTGGTNTNALKAGIVTSATAFTWVYIGEATLTDLLTARLTVNGWRTAGTGTLRIDRVLLMPHEQRSAVPAAYDGVRDHAAASLYDTRSVPTMVPR
jgi:hypothetical protein